MARKIKRRKKKTKPRVIRRISREPRKGYYPKFKPKTKKALLEALSAGATQKRACFLAGINRTTLYSWLKKGRERPGSKFHKFFLKVKEIEAREEINNLALIRKAAQGGNKYNETKVVLSEQKGRELTTVTKTTLPTWTAAAWILERRFPEDYGRDRKDFLGDRTPDEVASEVKAALDALQGSVPDVEQDFELPEDMPD